MMSFLKSVFVSFGLMVMLVVSVSSLAASGGGSASTPAAGPVSPSFPVSTLRYYPDTDGDGYGDDQATGTITRTSSSDVRDHTDCDDANSDKNPGESEVCDSIDNDCSGVADDNPTDGTTYYADGDSDGYGNPASTRVDCSRPTGYVTDHSDCDDANSARSPADTEACNGYDDDCDGATDEDGATGGTTYYADADGDGYGDPAVTQIACSQPAGYVTDSSDCDDAHSSAHPGRTSENCDGLDNDCNGLIDDNPSDMITFYADEDSDGYGDSDTPVEACSPTASLVADNTDCDDLERTTHPGGTEVCDEDDNDCNGVVDDNPTDGEVWYADADEDGYGDASSTIVACSAQAGHVTTAGDCDDTTDEFSPGRTEICNSVDDDCNGTADDGLPTSRYYLDRDGDGYGDSLVAQEACSQPPTSALQGMDCDDFDAAINPGATEYPLDGTDSDCDGHEFAATDADGDGVYLPSATGPDDCDDNNAAVYPGAQETCNEIDDDCNGTRDDITVAVTHYADTDEDGYGDSGSPLDELYCTPSDGYVESSTDCDDTDPDFHPNAIEACTEPIDYNCDGSVEYDDADLDGFGACEECDDRDASTYPGADEYCDGVNNDCDGETDESDAVDAKVWYVDADGDAYGVEGASINACTRPAGHASMATDCNDNNSVAHPGGTEVCGNGIDEDCNGADLSCAAAAATPTIDGTSTGGGTVTTGTGDTITSPAGTSGDSVDEDLADDDDDWDDFLEPVTVTPSPEAAGEEEDGGGGSCSLSMTGSFGANGSVLWMFCFIIFVWRFAKRLSV